MTQEEKMTRCFHLCNKWLCLKNKNVAILDYDLLRESKIAIYGVGYLGKRLLEELKNDNAKIEYIVDQDADILFMDYEVYKPNNRLKPADVMIVTPIWAYGEIKCACEKNFTGTIISLETIIESLWKKVWIENDCNM